MHPCFYLQGHIKNVLKVTLITLQKISIYLHIKIDLFTYKNRYLTETKLLNGNNLKSL